MREVRDDAVLWSGRPVVAIVAVGLDAIRGVARLARAPYTVIDPSALAVGYRRLARAVRRAVDRLAGTWVTGSTRVSTARRTATEYALVEGTAAPARVRRDTAGPAAVAVLALVARAVVTRAPRPSRADRAVDVLARACRRTAGWARREFVDQWRFGLTSLATVAALWGWIWTAL